MRTKDEWSEGQGNISAGVFSGAEAPIMLETKWGAGQMEFILAKYFTASLSPKDLGLLGSHNNKDAGDRFSSSKPYSLGQPFTCMKRSRQICIQAPMNNYSSIPENHTGTMLLIQSSEWGTLSLFLDKKTVPCSHPPPWENQSAIPSTVKIQSEFRPSDSIKMNLLLKTEEPSFWWPVQCKSKMYQKVHQIATKYTVILTVGESTLSPSLFCFNPKSSATAIIKDTASLGPSQPPSSGMGTASSSGKWGTESRFKSGQGSPPKEMGNDGWGWYMVAKGQD